MHDITVRWKNDFFLHLHNALYAIYNICLCNHIMPYNLLYIYIINYVNITKNIYAIKLNI